MTTPKGANHGVILDLAAVDRDLRKEDAYGRKGHTARTLVHEPDLRVVLVAMKGGSRIPEHRADETATVHVLSGKLRLKLPSGVVDLSEDQLLLLERGVPHDVEALAETKFLLALGWKAQA